ncbi:uncharacterized protein LOC126722252 [Quercus robur]|uniref:uncharacterized protein LOC126722252 n=1 Tax=Quercus robur TaxID=38942 RepID=UPI00216336BE|nr:uncharacterized protein LOC126722252 [Quercus robur]
MAFNDYYKQTPIILERIVDLDSLKGTFIPDVFKERTWTKLLNLMGDVFEDIIREFFANAIVESDHINYWLKGREFSITRESIDDADEEGGDTEKEIEHFTSVLEDTTQHSSQTRARAPNRLDHLIGRDEEMHCILSIALNKEDFDKAKPKFMENKSGEFAITRMARHFRPAHYLLKIQSYSLLCETGVEKYDSGVFEVGGHKWRLSLYPKGNEKMNGAGHISIYLSIVDTEKSPLGWEVNASFKLFVYDQIRDKFLTIQDVEGAIRRFHDIKTEWVSTNFSLLILSMLFQMDTLSMIVVYLVWRFLFMNVVQNESVLP